MDYESMGVGTGEMGFERGTAALPGEEIADIILPGQLAHLGIATAVPVVKVRWFDERQTCRLVHDYLEGRMEGALCEYGGCGAYHGGICRNTGCARLPCMFHEPEGAPIWQRARQWERVVLEDGARALQRRK